MAAATCTNNDDVKPCECFRVDYDDRDDLAELRQPVKNKLEAQYRQWQNHDQRSWRETLNSSSTLDFLGLDRRRTLRRLEKYGTNSSIPLAILSELHLCPIRPGVVGFYELESGADVTQWLHSQYRQYGIHIVDWGENSHRYYIPLLDFTVVAGDDPLLFSQRLLHDASSMVPCLKSQCRLVIFPQTRFSFVEDQIFQSLFPLHDEQFKIMSYNLLPYFRGTAGYYNSLASPFTTHIVQRSYAGVDIAYLAALYPVIKSEYLRDYENRKISERELALMQRHSGTALPAIAQARYSRRFDFPKEINLHEDDLHGGGPPERMQSSRGLYEFAGGEVDTMALDKHQISALESLERDPWQKPHILVVEPIWILAFPTKDLLCLFRNESGDSAIHDPYQAMINERSNGWTWARLLIEIVGKADDCMGRYEPTYRTWLAKLGTIFTVHRSIADPLQNQISILQNWRQFVEGALAADKGMLEMYDKAIIAREAHLGSFQRLLDQGKNTQALLFQLSSTETAYLQSDLARSMARETEIQSKLAQRAQRQNQSILIFTTITVIFLPLSFFTSYFGAQSLQMLKPSVVADLCIGMNIHSIQSTHASQEFFWAIAAPISLAIIVFASFFAYRKSIEHWYSSMCAKQPTVSKDEDVVEMEEA